MTHSCNSSAELRIVKAIEANGTASRDDFDIPGIVAHLRHLTGTTNLEAVEPSVFWETVARHAIDPQEG